jgi:multiple sugar transport system substrate-binding protein
MANTSRSWRLYFTAALALLLMAAPVIAEEKVVRVWHTETEPQTVQVLSDIARRFEAAHPGVKLEIEGLAWAGLEGKIAAALASGSPPELSHGQPITCTALHAKGLLLPLDEVVEAIGETNIFPQVRRVCHAEGRQFGLVHAVATSMMLYRRDMADALGVAQPQGWTDMIAAARKLTRDTDGDGRTDVYGVTLPGDNLFINAFLGELIKANGGILFDADHRPQLTDPKMIEVLEYLRKLLRYARPGWEGQNYLQSYREFIDGRAATMLFALGRGAGMIERQLPKEMASDATFGVWVKPHGPNGSAPAVQVDEEPWMLFKGSRHPKEAIEFLKFFYKDENYLSYVATVPIQLLPITRSAQNSERYHQSGMFQRWRSWIDAQRSYLEHDQAKPTLVMEWADMKEKPYLLDVLNSNILRDMVMEVVIERAEPLAAAEKAQKRLEALLASRGYAAPAKSG